MNPKSTNKPEKKGMQWFRERRRGQARCGCRETEQADAGPAQMAAVKKFLPFQ